MSAVPWMPSTTAHLNLPDGECVIPHPAIRQAYPYPEDFFLGIAPKEALCPLAPFHHYQETEESRTSCYKTGIPRHPGWKCQHRLVPFPKALSDVVLPRRLRPVPVLAMSHQSTSQSYRQLRHLAPSGWRRQTMRIFRHRPFRNQFHDAHCLLISATAPRNRKCG